MAEKDEKGVWHYKLHLHRDGNHWRCQGGDQGIDWPGSTSAEAIGNAIIDLVKSCQQRNAMFVVDSIYVPPDACTSWKGEEDT